MKRSELKFTGETYRLTPASWGETTIMVDEDAVAESVAEAFGLDSCDPDDDPNDKPETVNLAVDDNGKYYAVLEPFEGTSWGRKTGKMHNENMYRPCQDPAEVDQYGAISIYGQSWEIFDDEDDK